MADLEKDILKWAIEEIRGLDELCRGQIPYYESLDSNDMDKIHLMERALKDAE